MKSTNSDWTWELIENELQIEVENMPRRGVSLDEWQLEEVGIEAAIVVRSETALSLAEAESKSPAGDGDDQSGPPTRPNEYRDWRPLAVLMLVATFCITFLVGYIANIWTVDFRYFLGLMLLMLIGLGAITVRKITISISPE